MIDTASHGGLGATLKYLRLLAGLTQTQVAAKLQCAPNQISHLERETFGACRVSTLRRVAAVLGYDVVVGLRRVK